MSLTTGEVARQAEVNKQTLRYYEDRGLIDEPPRNDSNYRMYPEKTVSRLKFIKRAQELGFTLEEIQTLLTITEGDDENTKKILSFAEEKLREIRQKIEEYRKLEHLLSGVVEDCRKGDSYEPCPLIEILTGETNVE